MIRFSFGALCLAGLVAVATPRLLWADQGEDRGVQSTSTLSDTIQQLFNTQVAAWNRGDIEAFMQTYWKSDQLTFSSGGKTTRGWQATLQRYKQRYSTPDKMGRLSIDQLEIVALGDEAALALGRWHLQRGAGDLEGNFSAVLRVIDHKWVIVHDHSSSDTGNL